MLLGDGRLGWDCIDVVELWGVLFMGGGECFGNGVENGDTHCWIVMFRVEAIG